MKRALQFFFSFAIGISFLAATRADAQWTPMNPVRKVQQPYTTSASPASTGSNSCG